MSAAFLPSIVQLKFEDDVEVERKMSSFKFELGGQMVRPRMEAARLLIPKYVEQRMERTSKCFTSSK